MPTVCDLRLALLLCALAIAAAPARADDDDAITPYRPSVSSPAQLPVAGQLEMELGGLGVRSGGAHRDSLPYLLKLAFDKDWGVLLGGDAHVALRDASAGTSGSGWGDTNLVLKRAFTIDDHAALGLELGTKLPTAAHSLADAQGGDKADYTLNGIYSQDIGVVHMDANLNATRFGLVDAGTGRTQAGASASFSTPLSERWAVTGEISGTHRSGIQTTAQVLTALTFSPTKRLTFDVGLARAAHPSPGTSSLFAGVVFPLARLW